MCEVLVMAVDKVGDDPYLDAKQYKRGDVLVAVDDGWTWGTQELSNPLFRIIKLPNVALVNAQSFLGPDLDTDPMNPSRVLRRRGFGLNVDSTTLPAAFVTWWKDATRAAPTRTVNLTGAQLLALKISKPPLVDPNVIG